MAKPPPLDTEPPCATTREMSSQAAPAPSAASDANGRSEHRAAAHDSELQDAYVRGGIDMAARQFDLMRSEFSAQRERDLALAYQRGLEHGRRGTSERSVAGNDDDGPSSQHRVQSFQQAAARPEPENIPDGRRQQAPEETLLSIGRRTIDQRRDARPLRESQPMFSERQRNNIRATFQGLLNTGPARASRPSWPSARHPTDLRAQATASGRPIRDSAAAARVRFARSSSCSGLTVRYSAAAVRVRSAELVAAPRLCAAPWDCSELEAAFPANAGDSCRCWWTADSIRPDTNGSAAATCAT